MSQGRRASQGRWAVTGGWVSRGGRRHGEGGLPREGLSAGRWAVTGRWVSPGVAGVIGETAPQRTTVHAAEASPACVFPALEDGAGALPFGFLGLSEVIYAVLKPAWHPQLSPGMFPARGLVPVPSGALCGGCSLASVASGTLRLALTPGVGRSVPSASGPVPPRGGRLGPGAGPAVNSTLLPGSSPRRAPRYTFLLAAMRGPQALFLRLVRGRTCAPSGCWNGGTPGCAEGQGWERARAGPCSGVRLLLPDHVAAPGQGQLLR